MGVPCGMTFRERLGTVRLDTGSFDTAERHNDFDAEALGESFGLDARERSLEATDGLGAGWIDGAGDSWHVNRHTNEPERLSPEVVDDVYLGGRTAVDA